MPFSSTRLGARRALAWLALSILGAAFVAALVERPAFWTIAGGGHRAVAKLTIHWGLAALAPLALALALGLPARWRRRAWGALLASLAGLALCGGLLWARFVEPNELRVIETPIGTSCGVRVALVSDLHLGLYVRESDLDRLVDRLNALDVDAVLVAGDWTYEPPHDLDAAFAAWGRLRHRSIGVLGNHDEQRPGPPVQRALRAALEHHGLEWAEARRLPLGRCELVGLGDLDAGSAGRDLGRLLAAPSPIDGARRIALAHQPDTLHLLPRGFATLLLSGHTHGGQVNLPLLSSRLLGERTEEGLKRGLYALPDGRVFVTSGTGTTKLPLRLRMPPTIDVLRL